MKKLTLTVGIPAHNEGTNIARLLESIISQEQNNFILEKLIVAADGCTDNTVEIVKDYSNKYNFVEIIDDGERYGQAGRLNNFYKLNKSDIFLTFDGDCILADNKVIEKIAACFYEDKVGLVSGLDTPFAPQNTFEKIVTTWLKIWYFTRRKLNNGDTIHNHHGVVSAISKEFTEGLEIPQDIKANDDYLYITAIKRGFKFKFADGARVLYRAPNSLKDFFLQHGRMYTLKERVYAYFGEDVKKYYEVPKKNKFGGLLHVFVRDPIFVILSLVFQVLLRTLGKQFEEKYKNGGISWQTAESTKTSPKELKGAF